MDDVLRDLARHPPLNITVMCPSGHLIAEMTLSVKGGAIAVEGIPSRNKLRRNRSQGKPTYSGAVHAGPDWNTVLTCVNSRCTFSGYYNSQNLALELAQAALRARITGHAEYRLPR
jgi:hypothetical protein